MVLYTICFDLNAEPIEQLKQVEYWLSYLNSILCNAKPIPPTHATAKWRIILVGTRADLAESEPKTPANIDNYRKAYPVLPIYHELFTISTKNDGDEQLASLCEALKVECKRILDIHSAAVPCAHKDLLQLVQASPKHIIHESDIPKVQIRWDIENTLELSLDYLHSIGEVVRFTEGRVCIKPSIISQVLAKFIAPDDHVEESRAAFKKTDVAGILKTKVSEIDQKYVQFRNSGPFFLNFLIVSRMSWTCLLSLVFASQFHMLEEKSSSSCSHLSVLLVYLIIKSFIVSYSLFSGLQVQRPEAYNGVCWSVSHSTKHKRVYSWLYLPDYHMHLY